MNTGLLYSKVAALAAILRGGDKRCTVACEWTNDLLTNWFCGA